MTFDTWQSIEQLALWVDNEFKKYGILTDSDVKEFEWHNHLYTSNKFRRAHLQVVDKSKDHKIYILHTTVFPHFNDSSPIFGFDAICGQNKITGAFLDYSPGGDKNHPMYQEFCKMVSGASWSRVRTLPEWAQNIFSPNIVAAGMIKTEQEMTSVIELTKTCLTYYLENVGNSIDPAANYKEKHNYYCFNQKQNPQVVNSMVAMGVEKAVIERFVDTILFPET
jgi:Ferredoxin-dependent bilin reductase